MFLSKVDFSIDDGLKIIKSPSFLLIISKLFFKLSLCAFLLILVRHVSATDFSDFQFISSMANVIAQPSYVFTMIIVYVGMTVNAHTDPKCMSWLVGISSIFAFFFVGLLSIIFFMLDKPLSHIANIQTHHAIIFGGFIIEAYIIFNIVSGFLLVKERFLAIAFAYFIISIVTLTGSFIIMNYSVGKLFAYAVQASALFIASIVIYFLASDCGLPKAIKIPISVFKWPSFRYFINSAITMLAFFLMLNVDIFAVKILTTENVAILYLQQELISKLFFVVASSIGSVVFSKAILHEPVVKNSNTNQYLHFFKSAPLMLCGSFLLVFVLTLISPPLISHIFGYNINVSKCLIAMLLTARLLQSCIFILILKQGSKLSFHHMFIMLACALVELGLMIFAANGVYSIATIMLVCSMICLIFIGRISVRKPISLFSCLS